MKISKILMILLSLMLVFGTVLTFVSCGGTTTAECTEHKDENGDGICDTEGCGATVEAPKPMADAFNANGELYLFKAGVPTFRFVLGSEAVSKQRAAIEELTAALNNGEGTAGMLLKDSALYLRLNETCESANALLEDLKENPKRYVHFSIFGNKQK